MKKTFIPKGTAERHENIHTDELVVKGELTVNGVIRAKRICGNGIIIAKRIISDTVIADTIEVEHISAKRIIANRIFCITASASIGIIAKDHIHADCVKTTRLTSTISQINKTEANEIIRLSPKRSFIGTLFSSWVKERFAARRHKRILKKNPNVKPSDTDSGDLPSIEFETLMESYRTKYLKGGYKIVLEAVDTEFEEDYEAI